MSKVKQYLAKPSLVLICFCLITGPLIGLIGFFPQWIDFELFIGRGFVLVWVCVIFVATVLSAWILHHRLRETIAGLETLCTTIKKYAPDKLDAPNLEYEERFRNSRPDLNDAILNDKKIPAKLHATWREFDETFFSGRKDGLTHNVYQAEEFFYPEAVMASVNLGLFRTVGGMLVGLGILGTFIGLAAGVGIAAPELSASDLTSVKAALQNLLGGAALAFVTSIAGLVCSLFYNYFEQSKLHAVKKECNALVELLNKMLRRSTSQALLHEIKELTAEQKETMQGLASSIASEISNKLSEQLATALDSVISKLYENASTASSDAATNMKDQFTEISKVLQDFPRMLTDASESLKGITEKMGNAANDTIAEIDRSTKKTQDNIDKSAQILNENISDFAQTELPRLVQSTLAPLQAANDEARERIQAMQQSQEDLVTGFRSMATEVEKSMQTGASALQQNLNEATNRMAQVLDATATKLHDVPQQIEASSAGLSEVVANFDQLHNAQQQLGAKLDSTTDALTANTERMAQTASVLGDSVANVTKIEAELHNAISKIQQAQEAYRERFADVDESLAQTLDTLGTQLEKYQTSVTEFVSGVTGQFVQAVSDLGKAVAEFGEEAKAVAEARDRGEPRR